MLKSLGRGAIYLSTILSLAGLVLFGIFQNLYMLAFVLLLLGAARSFGAPIREITFCGQKEVQDYGEGRAMGLYNFADNIGDSLGTVVFGSILTVGFSFGMAAQIYAMALNGNSAYVRIKSHKVIGAVTEMNNAVGIMFCRENSFKNFRISVRIGNNNSFH